MAQNFLQTIFSNISNRFNHKNKYEFKGKYSATDVAQYILWYCKRKHAVIKQKDLQTILFLIQLYSLKEKQKAFFVDDFIARSTGPVILDVSLIYLRGKVSPSTEFVRPAIFSKETEHTIRVIIDSYLAIDSKKRSRFACRKNGAWESVYRDGKGFGKYISKKKIARECQGLKHWNEKQEKESSAVESQV